MAVRCFGKEEGTPGGTINRWGSGVRSLGILRSTTSLREKSAAILVFRSQTNPNRAMNPTCLNYGAHRAISCAGELSPSR
jgi:hypothetical protein